jgi:O-antigen/teichoic acid export membrane protein
LKIINFLRSFLKERGAAQQTFILIVASTIGNIFSYLYLLFASRSMGTESYGKFGSLFGIFYIFSLMGDALRITIASRVASLKGTTGNANSVKSVLKPLSILLVIGLLIILAIMVNSGHIAAFFHLSNSGPVLVLGLSLIPTFFLFIILGILQGLQLFGWLASTGYLIPQVVKLLLGILFVYVGWGLDGIIAALFASNLIAIVVGIFPLIKKLGPARKDTGHNDSSSFLNLVIPLALIGVVISIPTSVDVMLVTHFFNAYDAGLYNAATTMGKIVLFSPIAVSLVMLPLVSEKHSQGKRTANIMKLSLGVSVIISCIIVLLYWIWGDFLIRLFFGSQYLAARFIIIWYGIAMILFAANYLFAQYNLALSEYKWLIIALVVTLFEVAAIVIIHRSLLQVIIILVLGNLLLLAFNFFALYRRDKNLLLQK